MVAIQNQIFNLTRYAALVALFYLPYSEAQELTASPSKQVLDMVIAAVDGEPLTLSDLREHANLFGAKFSAGDSLNSPAAKELLRDLLANRLFAKEAEALGITVSESEVDAYVEEVKHQNQVDAETFEAMLNERGLSIASYRAQVRAEIYKTRIVTAKIRSSVNILESDVKRYFTDHPELKPKPDQVYLHQIFVGSELSPEAKQSVEESLSRMRERIKAGELMQDVGGIYYSAVGYVSPADLRPELRKIIDEMSLNKVSDLVTTDQGIYLLLVTSKDGNIDESQLADIRQRITEEQIRQRLDRLVTEELPKKYHVELKI